MGQASAQAWVTGFGPGSGSGSGVRVRVRVRDRVRVGAAASVPPRCGTRRGRRAARWACGVRGRAGAPVRSARPANEVGRWRPRRRRPRGAVAPPAVLSALIVRSQWQVMSGKSWVASSTGQVEELVTTLRVIRPAGAGRQMHPRPITDPRFILFGAPEALEQALGDL